MKLGTIIAIIITLAGCGVVTTQMIRVNSEAAYIEKIEQEKQKLEKARTELEEKAAKVPAPKPPPIVAMSGPNRDAHPAAAPRHKNESNAPIGNRQPIILPTKPIINNAPNNLTVAEQLYKANVVFALPDSANVDEDIQAQLIIDPTKTLDEIKKNVRIGTVKSAEEIKISKIVIARLSAPDFTITSASSTEQAIIEDSKTEWIWMLRPLRPGLHPINLVIEAQVTVGNRTTPHFIRTFDKQVMIEITSKQVISNWWSRYWQWVLSTLVLPLLIWFYKNKFSKVEKSK